MAPDDGDDPVLAQYEAYPYPARDPRDEAKRLITGSPSHLAEVNHYLFAGRRDFALPFRALVAGGGTGDAAIMLAQQLTDEAGPGPAAGEVVYLDISTAAREIAEARAAARGLTNIRFLTGSLLDLAALGLGRFDYVDCCGVLHHLADPAAGLAALAAALAAGGGLGVMVYGALGRTGVYPLQQALRELGAGLPLAERVDLARRLIGDLPATNWFRRNPFLGDHKRSDAELVDLLLHARDRAYRVTELVALLAAADLAPVAFLEPLRYDPASYLGDPKLLARLDGLAWTRRAAVAEALAGNMKTHVVYAAPCASAAGRVAQPDGPEAVPLFSEDDGPAMAEAIGHSLSLTANFDGVKRRLALPRLAPAMLARIDGRASLGDIHRGLQALDSALDWAAFKAQFDQLYRVLNGLNRLLLRYPSAPG
ncbi:MAG TPA: class I SAM-dependent methyltransferase [Kiloniellales bacterium]